MKTPDEIKKGLECCFLECDDISPVDHCRACPYQPNGLCFRSLITDALAYIQQLEAAQPKWINPDGNGFYISCGGPCILDDDDMFFGADGVEGMYSVDPSTVGQYTGLKDRNGVRIFEGDIIKATYRGNYGRYAFEVVFDDGKFALRKDGIVIEMYDGYRPEVIGNIHDNPELLEVQND